MKLVTAFIQPPKLPAVLAGLARLGVERLTVCDGQGYARQRGQSPLYRGHEYKTQLLRKVILEIVVNDDYLDRTIQAITQLARTGPDGQIGDGKILVTSVDQAIQIGGTVRGPEAV